MQKEGTTTQRIGSGSKAGAVEETMDTKDSSPVPPDPHPAPPWTDAETSINDSEVVGRKSLDCRPGAGEEGRPQNSVAVNPFTLERLQTSSANFHRLSEGNMEYAGLLLSESAQYPLPPGVVRRILGFVDSTIHN